jgi:hypothetical protein
MSPLPAARAPSTFESAQLIANEARIDPALLMHENPNHCTDLASPLPLDQYKLNVDRCPLVVRRKPQEKVQYLQQVAVRYLKPPPPPKGGDVIIRELPSRQIAPAPALVVRQNPPKAHTPPPLILRLVSLLVSLFWPVSTLNCDEFLERRLRCRRVRSQES